MVQVRLRDSDRFRVLGIVKVSVRVAKCGHYLHLF